MCLQMHGAARQDVVVSLLLKDAVLPRTGDIHRLGIFDVINSGREDTTNAANVVETGTAHHIAHEHIT